MGKQKMDGYEKYVLIGCGISTTAIGLVCGFYIVPVTLSSLLIICGVVALAVTTMCCYLPDFSPLPKLDDEGWDDPQTKEVTVFISGLGVINTCLWVVFA